MFSIFKKKPTGPVYRDIIWYSEEIKQKAILSLCNKKQVNELLIIGSSFPIDLLDIQHVCANQGEFEKIKDISEIQQTNPIHVLNNSSLLDLPDYQINRDIPIGTKITFVLLEHYPLLPVDEKLRMKIEQQLPGCEMAYFISLDDAFFQPFGAERIKNLLEKLDINKNEMLENSMISNSIKNAQKKFTKTVKFEKKADSMEDWVKENYDGK